VKRDFSELGFMTNAHASWLISALEATQGEWTKEMLLHAVTSAKLAAANEALARLRGAIDEHCQQCHPRRSLGYC